METVNKLDRINEIADEVGGTVRSSYSGRGMYGKSCVGIVCSDPNECLEVAGAHGIRGGVVDSMGLSFIVYWPKISSEVK